MSAVGWRKSKVLGGLGRRVLPYGIYDGMYVVEIPRTVAGGV